MVTVTPQRHRGGRRTRSLRRRFSSGSTNARRTERSLLLSPTPSSVPRGRTLSVSPRHSSSREPWYPYPNSLSISEGSVGEDEEGAISSANDGHGLLDEPFDQPEEVKPRTYASLPPTPIEQASPTQPHSPFQHASPDAQPHSLSYSSVTSPPLFSLWDYFREELLATDFDSHQEVKWERVSNFLNIPLAIEKIILFGFTLCLDSFLYTFTILPIRFVLASWRLFLNTFSSSAPPLPPSQKADILRALLLIVSVSILVPLADASKIYHSIRGQETIKLYVIFNALEIADRLCASIGQDILDCLFSRSILEPLSHRLPVTSRTFRPFAFFILATLYTVAHTAVMMYQLLALNVAVNSYDHALLTLLVSNQFVEIKGSVFKKFEKDNLFQITCADIVERFTLALMLSFVAFRNLIELSGSVFDFTEGFFLPKSFAWSGNNVFWTISYPVLTVMVSEMLVDWLKHAFITKFNHIRPSVYERYTDVLCRDLASGSAVGRLGARKHAFVDRSPLVVRRLGFASLPLAGLAILVGSQSLNLLFASHYDSSGVWAFSTLTSEEIIHYAKWMVMGFGFWLCFVGIKIIMGVKLLIYATKRRAGMEAREAGDVVNDYGRDPIGEGKEEQKYNRGLKTMLDDTRDDAAPTSEMGELQKDTSRRGTGEKRPRVKLEDLTRFTMVKRIW